VAAMLPWYVHGQVFSWRNQGDFTYDQPWLGTRPTPFPGGDVSLAGAVGNVISIPIRATMEREKQE
jgi:hypothetical protein